MDGRTFYRKVQEHLELDWIGVLQGKTPADDEAVVSHRATGITVALPVSEILSLKWSELEAVLTRKRPLRVMTHLSRIVGYFSQVQNWNRSKQAEGRDRGRGAYSLKESAPRSHKPRRTAQTQAAPVGAE